MTGTMEAQNPYVRNQFGFNFGGPIVRNKTFFFVDAEWQRFRTTLTNRSDRSERRFQEHAERAGRFDYTDYDPNDCALRMRRHARCTSMRRWGQQHVWLWD